MGLHSDNPPTIEDSPADLPPDETSVVPAQTPQADTPGHKQNSDVPDGTQSSSDGAVTIIEEDPKTGEQKESKVAMKNFWAYVKAKMAAAQSWANEVLASLKGNHKASGGDKETFDQGDQPA